jgi:arsenate reductase
MVPGDDFKPGGLNKPGGARGERYKLLGPRRENPHARPRGTAPANPQSAPSQHPQKATSAKKRVLFVCIGNACRSQIAEAFARAYGSDIMDAQSAGVSPATMIAPQTRQVLAEWNLQIDGHFPKGLEIIRHQPFDLVVNMSGMPVTLPGVRVVDWAVPDPMGQRDVVHRTVAAQLEGLVMRLILELRTGSASR